jgi:AbrB family looped-hinge helix DNA binding protein
MVAVAKVTSKGQVTLPASIRRRLKLRKGSRIVFLEHGNEVRLVTEEELVRRFEVFDRRREELGLTSGDLQSLLKEAKERLWAARHGGVR